MHLHCSKRLCLLQTWQDSISLEPGADWSVELSVDLSVDSCVKSRVDSRSDSRAISSGFRRFSSGVMGGLYP